MSISDYQNEYFKYYQLFKGNYYKGVSILRGMLADPVLGREVSRSKAAVAAIYADNTRSALDKMCLDVLTASAYANDATLTHLNIILEKNYADANAFVADTATITAIAGNATILAIILPNAYIMGLLSNNEAAMNTMISNSVSYSAINASPSAALAVCSTSIGVAKLATKRAGLNHTLYADFNAIMASSSAINSVLGSAGGLNASLKNSASRTLIAGYANLNTQYAAITAAVNDTTYFSKKFDFIDSGSTRAIAGGLTDKVATANQSIFLCKKVGSYTSGVSTVSGAKHLQTGVQSGSSVTTTLGGNGGFTVDDANTNGVPLSAVCIGGGTIQEVGDAYICGTFAYAI